MATDDLRYAGFWPRLGAHLLDLVILAPLSVLLLWGSSKDRLFVLDSLVPFLAFEFFYDVFLVRRLGGTPGKLIAGIRIRKVDGSPVGWREAVLRHLPAFLIGLTASIAMVQAHLRMTDAEFVSLTFLEYSRRVAILTPGWYRVVNWIGGAWNWSELIVLLTNRKRRALHDFVAGTVVVHATGPAPAARPVVQPLVEGRIGD